MDWVTTYFSLSEKAISYFLIYKDFVNAHFLLACTISLACIFPISFIIISAKFGILMLKQQIDQRDLERHYKFKNKYPK